ncbi:MAG: M36 family metallopeptidase [Oligoflexales bacterium]|nr:M36 family metallopeptidase [Oligoflexales bacterium]
MVLGKNINYCTKIAMLASLLLIVPQVSALTFVGAEGSIHDLLNKNFRSTDYHRKGRSKKNKVFNRSFQLFGHQISDFDTSLREYLYEQNLNPYFSVREFSNKTKLSRVQTTKLYSFYFKNVPLCEGYVQVSINIHHEGPIIVGDIPSVSAKIFQLQSDFPSKSQSIELISENFLSEEKDFNIINQEKCFYVNLSGEATPAVKTTFNHKFRSYRAVSSMDEIFSLSPLFLNVDANLSVYEKNPIESSLETKVLAGLKSTGYLETEKIKTQPDPNDRAHKTDYNFIYSAGNNSTAADNELHEVNIFYHANKAYEWFQALGYEWHTEKTMTLLSKIGSEESSEQNNAYYQPVGGEQGEPIIFVAEGDGTVLQNLTFDTDVVTHEFAHHIIFQSVNNLSNKESVVIHEGLADFFTFAKSGDNCLGESVCPEGSGACIIETQCLRSGEFDLKFGDENYLALDDSHYRSQVVSGALWSIVEDDIMSLAKLTELVMLSLEFMPSKAKLLDFVLAIFEADKEINGGINACKIHATFTKRNLNETLPEDFDCSDYGDATNPIVGDPVNEDPNSQAIVSKTSKSKKNCGTITIKSNSASSNTILLWLIILSPVIFIIKPSYCASRRFK